MNGFYFIGGVTLSVGWCERRKGGRLFVILFLYINRKNRRYPMKVDHERRLSNWIGRLGEVIALHEYLNYLHIAHRYEHLMGFADGMPVVAGRISVSPAHSDFWLLNNREEVVCCKKRGSTSGLLPTHLDMRIEDHIGRDAWISYGEVKTRTKNRWDVRPEDYSRVFGLNGYACESLLTIQKSKLVRKPLIGSKFFFVLLEETRERIRAWVDDVHVGLHWMVKCLIGDRQYDVRMFNDTEFFIHPSGKPTLEVSAWRKGKKLTENRSCLEGCGD